MPGKERKKCCANCIHSRWWLTPTGRVPNSRCGSCDAPVDAQKILDDIARVLPSCLSLPTNLYKRSIWDKDGENCPLYQLNDGEKFHQDGTRFTKE